MSNILNDLISLVISNHGIIFLVFLLMNIFDWITGCIKARLKKQENSSFGFKGILKKIVNWIIVFFSFLLSYAFIALGKITGIDMEIAAWFGWFVLIYLIVNEFRSILENLVECNYKVPKILIKGLKVFEEKIEGNNA